MGGTEHVGPHGVLGDVGVPWSAKVNEEPEKKTRKEIFNAPGGDGKSVRNRNAAWRL